MKLLTQWEIEGYSYRLLADYTCFLVERLGVDGLGGERWEHVESLHRCTYEDKVNNVPTSYLLAKAIEEGVSAHDH